MKVRNERERIKTVARGQKEQQSNEMLREPEAQQIGSGRKVMSIVAADDTGFRLS